MKSQGKLIINTDTIRVYWTGAEHTPFIKMSSGQWIEHNSLPGDLKGLLGSLMLAQDVCAGKFYPKRLVHEDDVPKEEGQLRVLSPPRSKLIGRIDPSDPEELA